MYDLLVLETARSAAILRRILLALTVSALLGCSDNEDATPVLAYPNQTTVPSTVAPSTSSTTTTSTTTTTLPCSEVVIYELTDPWVIRQAASDVSFDVLGRDLTSVEHAQVKNAVHDLERNHAVTLCEVERGERREYERLDWNAALPRLVAAIDPEDAEFQSRMPAYELLFCFYQNGWDADCP